MIVHSDYENDPDLGKVVECLELFGAGVLPSFAKAEGPVWRVDRMCAQWDDETWGRIEDEPFVGDWCLMPIGKKREEMETASSDSAEPPTSKTL